MMWSPANQDERFLLDDFEPAYLSLSRSGAFGERVERALRELESCRACPRDCGCNRIEDRTGACHTGRRSFRSFQSRQAGD